MSRRPAKVTQADVARAIRAAQQACAGSVVTSVTILPDGAVKIDLASALVPANDLDRELAAFEARHGTN